MNKVRPLTVHANRWYTGVMYLSVLSLDHLNLRLGESHFKSLIKLSLCPKHQNWIRSANRKLFSPTVQISVSLKAKKHKSKQCVHMDLADMGQKSHCCVNSTDKKKQPTLQMHAEMFKGILPSFVFILLCFFTSL